MKILIMVDNVALGTKIEDLTYLFTVYGQVFDIHGFGDHYQLQMEATAGRKAIKVLNNIIVKGSPIRLEESNLKGRDKINQDFFIRLCESIDSPESTDE